MQSNFVIVIFKLHSFLMAKVSFHTGLLLREIKDFWRVALLLSTLLYPPDVNCSENFPKQYFQLDKQRDLFKAVESAITKLGMGNVSFTILLSSHLKLIGGFQWISF